MSRLLLVTFLALVAFDDAARGASDDPKATYSIILTNAGDQTIAMIKLIRAVTGLGLRDAKALSGSSPCEIRSGLSHSEATTIANQFLNVGAKVELRSQQ